MRWIEFIYKQYLNDLGEEPMQTNADISNTEIENIRNAQKNIKTGLKIMDNRVNTGDILMIGSLFFAISDTEQYPYEVFIISPYWELASDKDLIAKSKDNKTWVIESMIRYVTDEILEKSIKIDSIPKDDILSMQNYIRNNLPLPKKRTGLSYEKGLNSYQELFKEHERKRSLLLTIESLPEDELEIPQEIELNIKNSKAESSVIDKVKNVMAAASFEEFIVTKFGEIIKKENKITINFDEEVVGTIAKIYLTDYVIYEGAIPEKLNIQTNIEHIEQIKDALEIEFL